MEWIAASHDKLELLIKTREEERDTMAILDEPIKDVPTLRNYINGEWVEASGELLDVVNPVKNETIAQKPRRNLLRRKKRTCFCV